MTGQTLRRLWRDRWPIAVLTLALTVAIGLVVVWLAAFNGILLKPWAVPDVDSVVTSRRGVSPTEFRLLRERATTARLAAVAQTCPTVRLGEETQGTRCELVSGDYFDVLRLRPLAGRSFRQDEDIAGAPVQVVMISDGFWRDYFDRSLSAVGAELTINGLPFTVVGVLPPGVWRRATPVATRLWFPLAAHEVLNPSRDFLFDIEQCCVDLVGRRTAQVETVSKELTSLHRQIVGSVNEVAPLEVTDTRLINQRWTRDGPAVIALVFVGVMLVFVVAAINAAILQYGRGVSRRQEFLIRQSLGARRRQLVGMLAAESAVLVALISASVLVVVSLAVWELERYVIASSGDLTFDLRPDWRVVLGCLTLACVAVVGSGISPVLRAAAVTGGPPRRRGGLLLGVQIASGTTLVLCAAFLAAAVNRVLETPGFDAQNVGRVVFLDAAGHQLGGERAERVVVGVAALRGSNGEALVASVGSGGMATAVTTDDGLAVRGTLRKPASANYLPMLDVPLVAGRFLSETDGPDAVVVNEAMARIGWPGQGAVGQTFDAGRPHTVVGVVGNLRTSQVGKPVPPTWFEVGTGTLLVTRVGTESQDRLAAAARSVENDIAVKVIPLQESIDRGLDSIRVVAGVVWAIGLIALVIASTGIFAVIRLVTDQRRREIGVRCALGAAARHIVGVVAGAHLTPIALGFLAGVGFAVLAAPLLRVLIVDVEPVDPEAFAIAGAVIAVAILAATWNPIRRALSVEPAEILRSE